MTEIFKISDTDRKDIDKEIRSFKKTLYFGPLIALAGTTILLIGISHNNVSTSMLWLVGFSFLIPPLALSLLAPPNAIRKYKKLTTEIQITENDILLIHADGTILKLEEFKLSLTEFRFRKKPNPAISINTNAQVPNSILLKEFFEEYDTIAKILHDRSTLHNKSQAI